MTIDLQNGLECWFTMDDVDVDGQRGIVRDRSGHGRHLALSGGVTTGVESPVGEALSFDGDDDYGVTSGYSGDDHPTITAALTLSLNAENSGESDYGFIGTTDNTGATSSGWAMESDTSNQTAIGFTLANDSGEKVKISTTDYWQVGKFRTGFITIDDDNGVARVHDEKGDELNSLTYSAPRTLSNNELWLAVEANATRRFLDADIAVGGVWSRTLEATEMNAFSRMTARKVSQL